VPTPELRPEFQPVQSLQAQSWRGTASRPPMANDGSFLLFLSCSDAFVAAQALHDEWRAQDRRWGKERRIASPTASVRD
jgi:hypothetical protein